MDYEQSQNFNERLSQWVAGQGFWFQLRYSMSGSGTKGTVVYHLLRFGSRLLILLLIVAIGGWIYLLKRTGGADYREQAQASLNSALGGTETKVGTIIRSGGELNMARLASVGGEETFYDSLEARAISLRMRPLDGVYGTWDPGTITLGYLNVELRTGADNPESAANFGEMLFQQHPEFELSVIEVADANFRWGTDGATRGSIEGSHLKMQRLSSGWRLHFQGGRFSQNWLRQLEIANLTVICDPAGFRFETADFRHGEGTTTLSGLTLSAGQTPEVQGNAIVHRLPLTNVMPAVAHDYLEGSISGEFQISGSPHTDSGIAIEGNVELSGSEEISLQDKIPLLGALSVIDVFNNYRRVDFREGSFSLKSIGGTLAINDINLKAGDLMTVEGDLMVRGATFEEIQAATSTNSSAPEGFGGGSGGDPFGAAVKDDSITLRRAASATLETEDGGAAEEEDLFGRISMDAEARALVEQEAVRRAGLAVYEGALRITLRGDAFERAEGLKQEFPPDPGTGRIAIRVPIRGNLFEVTQQQADEFYQRGRR